MLKSNYKTTNNVIINSLIELGDDLGAETKGKGRKFVSKFIEPGVAHYEEFGDVLITKETLDKFINTMVGAPVIIKHKDITDKNVDKERVGVISNVWFNQMDGWYYCDGIIWDKQAIDLVKNQGWNVSCTYDFESDKQPKTHNGKKIDMEFTDGEFLHLALVDNPRYERANIVMNSKAENEDRWITVHPNGEENKGRPLLIKDGESVGEALYRTYGDKNQQKLFDTKEYSKSKEDIKKDKDEQKRANKTSERIETIEYALKDRNVDDKTKEVLAKDLKKIKEEGLEGKKETSIKEEELITSPEDLKQVAEKKGVEKREVKPEDIGFEKETPYSQKDENRHQKINDLEDKAYKEFKTLHDNYIQGDVALSDFAKRKEQFNKKYKEAFKKLESDRFVSFEDFAKREHKQQEDKQADSPFGEDVKVIEHDKGLVDKRNKMTGYVKDNKGATVEQFGDGAYKVNFYQGTTLKNIKYYSTEKGMQKAVRDHLQAGASKEAKALETKTDLGQAETKYNDVLKKYNEASKARWKEGISSTDYYKAWGDYEKYKKELTSARREYAESIMSNFEKTDVNPYEERQEARKERYQELSQKAKEDSNRVYKSFQEGFDAIPMGQPIIGQRDANYRKKLWDKMDRSYELSKKSDYYAGKAGSVGKAGISADDANAIAKLADKYKSGVDSAEKRRIIDRVIDIHKRSTSSAPASESTDYGFSIERNSDLNRLQLKFDSIPDANTRAILKSNGFRWSPREKAWQRQLNGNAEGGLKRVIEKMKAENSLLEGIEEILEIEPITIKDIPVLTKLKNILNNFK